MRRQKQPQNVNKLKPCYWHWCTGVHTIQAIPMPKRLRNCTQTLSKKKLGTRRQNAHAGNDTCGKVSHLGVCCCVGLNGCLCANVVHHQRVMIPWIHQQNVLRIRNAGNYIIGCKFTSIRIEPNRTINVETTTEVRVQRCKSAHSESLMIKDSS